MTRKTLEKLVLRKTTRPRSWLKSPTARAWLKAHALVLVEGEWKLMSEVTDEELAKVAKEVSK